MKPLRMLVCALLACALMPASAFAATLTGAAPAGDAPLRTAAPARDGEDHGALVASGSCGDNALFEWYEDGTVFAFPEMEGQPATVARLSLDRHNEWTIRDAGGTPIWYPVEGYSSPERESMLAALKAGFAKDNALRSLVVEDGITAIANSAFSGEEWLVPTLRSVELPERLDYLGSYAFQGLTQLASVKMPLAVGNNASYVFENTAVREAVLPVVEAPKDVGTRTDSLGRTSDWWLSPYYQWFDRCQLLERIVVPEGATYLGGTPTESVTDIDVQAFGYRLPRLRYLVLPSTLDEISSGSLDWYRSLEWVRFKGQACPGFAGAGNLFTERFAGKAAVYYPAGGAGYGYGWSGSVARANEWIDVRIFEVPDFSALPGAGAVSLDDADACAAIRAARAFWDASGDEARSWAGDPGRFEAASGALYALELQATKDGAKAELAGYRDSALYREEQRSQLAAAVASGCAAIDAAADGEAVAAALAAAEAEIGAIPTDEQLAAEEQAAAEEAAREAWERNHDLANATVAVAGATYTGKPLEPAVTVRAADGTALEAGSDFSVSYSGNVHAGTGVAEVSGMGPYTGAATARFAIARAANAVKLGKAAASKSYKAAKKTGKLAASKAFKLAVALKAGAAFGKLSFSKRSGTKYVVVARNGKVTVRKGLARGTYKVKVAVSAAGGADWKAASRTVAVKIRVK